MIKPRLSIRAMVLAFFSILLILFSSCTQTVPEERLWSVMIYMSGAKREALSGYVSKCLDDIATTIPDSASRVRVYVMTGGVAEGSGSTTYWSNRNLISEGGITNLSLDEYKRRGEADYEPSEEWFCSNESVRSIDFSSSSGAGNYQVWQYKYDETDDEQKGVFEEIELIQSKGMNESSALSAFIRTCNGSRDDKAKNMLIISSNGSGSYNGLIQDDNSPNSCMSIRELNEALRSAGVHFKIIATDVPTMASIEAISLLKNHTNYYIASQESALSTGYDYSSILKSLYAHSSLSDIELTKIIVDLNTKKYSQGDNSYNDNYTISAIDMTAVDQLIFQYNDFMSYVYNDISAGNEYFDRIIKSAKLRDSVGMYDINRAARSFYGEDSDKYIYIYKAISNAVVAKSSSISMSDNYGISFYFYFPDALLFVDPFDYIQGKNEKIETYKKTCSFSPNYQRIIDKIYEIRYRSEDYPEYDIDYNLSSANAVQFTKGKELISNVFISLQTTNDTVLYRSFTPDEEDVPNNVYEFNNTWPVLIMHGAVETYIPLQFELNDGKDMSLLYSVKAKIKKNTESSNICDINLLYKLSDDRTSYELVGLSSDSSSFTTNISIDAPLSEYATYLITFDDILTGTSQFYSASDIIDATIEFKNIEEIETFNKNYYYVYQDLFGNKIRVEE